MSTKWSAYLDTGVAYPRVPLNPHPHRRHPPARRTASQVQAKALCEKLSAPQLELLLGCTAQDDPLSAAEGQHPMFTSPCRQVVARECGWLGHTASYKRAQHAVAKLSSEQMAVLQEELLQPILLERRRAASTPPHIMRNPGLPGLTGGQGGGQFSLVSQALLPASPAPRHVGCPHATCRNCPHQPLDKRCSPSRGPSEAVLVARNGFRRTDAGGYMWTNLQDNPFQLKRSGANPDGGPHAKIESHNAFGRANCGGYLWSKSPSPFALKRSGKHATYPSGEIHGRFGFQRTAGGAYFDNMYQ